VVPFPGRRAALRDHSSSHGRARRGVVSSSLAAAAAAADTDSDENSQNHNRGEKTKQKQKQKPKKEKRRNARVLGAANKLYNVATL